MTVDEIPGWLAFDNRQKLSEFIERYQIKTVLEIGTCYGLSACWFAERVEHVTCIDLWSAIPCAGVPENVYDLFLSNVEKLRLRDKITVIRGNSHAPEVQAQVGQFDLVYIDGDHFYHGVKQDIQAYGPKARKVLCGDDYDPLGNPDLEGVPKAVDEMIPDREALGRFWWKIKEGDTPTRAVGIRNFRRG